MAKTTTFYGLPLFDEGDPANLIDQYNRAMTLIDRQMHIIATAQQITAISQNN